jgi:hypothetical protein
LLLLSGLDSGAGQTGSRFGKCSAARANAGTLGGCAFGHGSVASYANNHGGSCVGHDGKAHAALPKRNIECLLGLVYELPRERNMVLEHLHWYATSAAHCSPIVKAVAAPRGEVCCGPLSLGLASGCRGGNVSRNPAEDFLDGSVVLKARNATAGNLSACGEVGQRAAHLGQPEPKRHGNLRVTKLAVSLDVIEDR